MNTTTMEPTLTMERDNRTQPWQGFFNPLVSFAAHDLFMIANFFLVTLPVCSLGVFTNIANIIVYCKMGFSESSNVNFLVLSVFDFFLCVTSLLGRGSFSPLLRGLSIAPQLYYFGHCVGAAVIVMTCGSALMTGLISTERCVCVVFPLKVKTLLSRKRSLYLTMTIVAYHVALTILLYSDPGPPYDVYTEKTPFYYFSLYVIPSTSCYFIVVFTTFILIIKLRSNQRWRRDTASQATKSSDKEDKLIRTIIAISTIFIICSSPNVAVFIAQIIYPPLNYSNPYLGTLIQMLFDIGFDFQTISSSVNIFFYYTMSSKYKKYFRLVFSKRPENSEGDLERKALG